jgi:predicted amidohydrolase
MSWQSKRFITLVDLYQAYRKAKANQFYERDYPSALAFYQFEEDLDANLRGLLAILNSARPSWPQSAGFVGSFSYVPKSLKPVSPRSDGGQTSDQFIASNADSAWANSNRASVHEASFRIVGVHPVEMHVVAALWISKVGHKYDAALGNSAYGTRLRRRRPVREELGAPTRLTLGSFEPYAHQFHRWRVDGLQAIQRALMDEQHVVALTTDVRQFYHQVSPAFLLEESFLAESAIDLSADERRFTSQLVAAIRTWAAGTPDHRPQPDKGLPVGLSAARLIANVALVAFDRFVERELSPLYYGRYVDDVFLVLGNQRGISSPEALWQYIIARSNGLVRATPSKAGGYKLNLSYTPKSDLVFGKEKQRVFSLSGTSGLSLLAAIERSIRELSSEWRLLPEAESDRDIVADFLAPGRDATSEVDSLRKSDGATVRRLAFALRLRNLEAMERDLAPEDWYVVRREFFELVRDHVMTVPGLFAYSPYIPRLIGLAVATREWEAAEQIISRIEDITALVVETVERSDRYRAVRARDQLLLVCFQAAAAALGPDPLERDEEGRVDGFFRHFGRHLGPGFAAADASKHGSRMFQRDLARRPFRDAWLGNAARPVPQDATRAMTRAVRAGLRVADVVAFLETVGIQKDGAPPAALFPTRPLRIAEITQLDQQTLRNPRRLTRWARGLRGIEAKVSAPRVKGTLTVPLSKAPTKPVVALPCHLTRKSSWAASVTQRKDPDALGRYERINALINAMIRSKPKPDYVVMPELSLPPKWFGRIARKLMQSRVSLIAGVEYQHHGPAAFPDGSKVGLVSNQVWVSLVTDSLGYLDNVVYVQEKKRPAHDEEAGLWGVGGKVLRPINVATKNVIRHGLLHFGILICSELTNVQYRRRFRGRVDALIVPEWNQDTGSFASLVEASALDIHCFVVQVNNREFGDCRIRAPFKESYQRDIARISGGETDYFVVAELDIPGLRAFQSHHRSPKAGLFKPVPDGFRIVRARSVRPL